MKHARRAIWLGSVALQFMLIGMAIHSHWYDGDLSWRRWSGEPAKMRTCFFVGIAWGQGTLYFSQTGLSETLPAASYTMGDFARDEPHGLSFRTFRSIADEPYRKRTYSLWVQDVIYRMQWVEPTGPAQIDSRRWNRPGYWMYFTHIVLPLWVPITALGGIQGLVAAGWLYRYGRVRRRRKAGHCEKCGYDRRGSQGPCPECGFA